MLGCNEVAENPRLVELTAECRAVAVLHAVAAGGALPFAPAQPQAYCCWGGIWLLKWLLRASCLWAALTWQCQA